MFVSRDIVIRFVALASFVRLVFAASPTAATFFESAVPVASPTSTTQHIDLTNSIQNQAIWPNWTVINELARVDPEYAEGYFGYSITCQNCTCKGSVDVSVGNYNASGNSTQALESWTKGGGFIEYVLTGFQMNMSLQIDFQPNFTNASVGASVFQSTTTQLQLASHADLPLELMPIILYGVELNKTGLPSLQPRLSVSIPDGATLYLNLSHPQSSFVHGFSNAIVSTDFANASSLPDFSFSQGLQLSVQGFPNQTADGSNIGLIEGYMILPNVTSTFTSGPKSGSVCADGPDPALQVNNTGNFNFDVFGIIGTDSDDGSALLINDPLDAHYYQGADGSDSNVNVIFSQYNFSLPAMCLSGSASGTKSAASTNRPMSFFVAVALGLVYFGCLMS